MTFYRIDRPLDRRPEHVRGNAPAPATDRDGRAPNDHPNYRKRVDLASRVVAIGRDGLVPSFRRNDQKRDDHPANALQVNGLRERGLRDNGHRDTDHPGIDLASDRPACDRPDTGRRGQGHPDTGRPDTGRRDRDIYPLTVPGIGVGIPTGVGVGEMPTATGGLGPRPAQ